MNYVTATIIDIMKDRFEDDVFYLTEKLKILKKHKNKFDGLEFLVSADRTTKEMYAERTELTLADIEQLKDMWYKL